MKEFLVHPFSMTSDLIDQPRCLPVAGIGSNVLNRLQYDVLEAVASGRSLDHVALLLCHHVERLVPEIVCSVLTVDPEGRLHPLAAPGLPEDFSRAIDGISIGPDVGSCGAAAYHGHPVEVIDIDVDPRWMSYKAMPLAAGFRGCWSSPIKGRDGRVVGTFAFYYRTRRHPSLFERSIVATSIHLCALAIEHDAIWSRLQQANQRFDAALGNMSQGLSFFAADRLIVANRRYIEIYRLPPDHIRAGMSHDEVMGLRVIAGSDPAMTLAEYGALRDALSRELPTDIVLELRDGRTIAIHFRPLPNAEWVSTHEDITERRRAEARVVYLAHHDALTGLPNRVLFDERMQQALALSEPQVACAVLCLDLDHFKTVNDTFGHPAGDRLLQGVASRLRDCIRSVDTVTRLGGDEFAILLVGLDDPKRAGELALRIVQVMGEPFDLDGHAVVVGISIGIALSPHDGVCPSKLLKSADTALYRAKADERGSYRFFEAEMDARLQARFTLERDLRVAVQDGEFELAYQPIFNLATGMISGFEALLRWPHATRGLVMPGAFIQLAEETGLIVPLGAWVLQQACAEAAGWPVPIRIAVNLSAMQFRDRKLVETVRQALSVSGLLPARLELEITESIFLSNTAETLATLHELRGLGVGIAMDDFGTGYSSLSYLRSFPFDKIKIDQSFIRDLSEREDSLSIIRAVVGLARSLRMVTTAEGVETRDQLAQLRHEGCTEVQGYLFSRPISAEAARRMMTCHPSLGSILHDGQQADRGKNEMPRILENIGAAVGEGDDTDRQGAGR